MEKWSIQKILFYIFWFVLFLVILSFVKLTKEEKIWFLSWDLISNSDSTTSWANIQISDSESIITWVKSQISSNNFTVKPSYSSWKNCAIKPRVRHKVKKWSLISARFDKYDDRLLQRVFQEYPLYTNDKTWAIQVLPFAWVSQAPKDLTPFLEISDIYWGATKKYWYLYSDIPVVKGELENYFPFQFLWIQAVDALVGYSSGYLVSFPFKFPVDDATFSYSIDPDFTDDYVDDRGGFRWKNFINGGIQYSKYLGDDKDRIYFRDVNQWNLTSHYAINRVKKAKDFCFYRNPDPDYDYTSDE